MILSSSILRVLAFASLAVPAASNSIRGSSPETQELDTAIVGRELAGTPNVGLGQMVCSENSDTSVSCTFRVVVPPTDRSSTLLFDCITGSRGNVCLSTQVSRVPFQQVPNQGIVAIVPEAPSDVSQPGTIVNVTPQTPGIPQIPPETTLETIPPQKPLGPQIPPQKPQQPTIPETPVVTTPNSNPNTVPSTGTCPPTRPLTGLGCGQSLSSGSQRTVCLYDDFRCTCLAQNQPLAWNCYRVMTPEQEPEIPEPEIPEPEIPEPEIPVTVDPPQVMTMPPAADDLPPILTSPTTGLNADIVSSETVDKCNRVVRSTISNARATSFQISEQLWGTVAKALAYLAIRKYSPHH